MWEHFQHFDGFRSRSALVQYNADSENATQARPPRFRLIDQVQGDAKAVFVHSIDTSCEPVGKANARVYPLWLYGQQHAVILAYRVVRFIFEF